MKEARELARLYPEAREVGLSVPLQAELERIGSPVHASWDIAPKALWSGAESGDRDARVVCAATERLFGLSLWGQGVEYLNGWTDSLPEAAAALDTWLSGRRPAGDELAAGFPFLGLKAYAAAYERGEAIELRWSAMLQERPSSHRARTAHRGSRRTAAPR